METLKHHTTEAKMAFRAMQSHARMESGVARELERLQQDRRFHRSDMCTHIRAMINTDSDCLADPFVQQMIRASGDWQLNRWLDVHKLRKMYAPAKALEIVDAAPVNHLDESLELATIPDAAQPTTYASGTVDHGATCGVSEGQQSPQGESATPDSQRATGGQPRGILSPGVINGAKRTGRAHEVAKKSAQEHAARYRWARVGHLVGILKQLAPAATAWTIKEWPTNGGTGVDWHDVDFNVSAIVDYHSISYFITGKTLMESRYLRGLAEQIVRFWGNAVEAGIDTGNASR